PPAPSAPAEAPAGSNRIESSRGERDYRDYAAHGRRYDQRYEQLGADERYSSLEGVPPKDLAGLSVRSTKRHNQRERTERDRPRELRSPEGPRQLPPAE